MHKLIHDAMRNADYIESTIDNVANREAPLLAPVILRK